MKKNSGIKIKDYELCAAAAVIFTALLVPLLYIAGFDHMAADDYSYGLASHLTWVNTHSVWEVIKTAASEVGRMYMGWQGTFSALFLMGLQPGVFSETAYTFVPYIMLGSLIASVLFFSHAMFSRLFGTSRSQATLAAFLWLCALIHMLPGAVEGFYWYNGSMMYTLFFALALVLYALVIIYASGGGRLCLVFICLLAAVVGGGNYATALLTALVLALTEAVLAVHKNKKSKTLIIPAIIFAASFAVNAASPGNAVRQAGLEGCGAVETIFESMRAAFTMAENWFNLPLAVLLAGSVPLLCKAAARSKLKFGCPMLVIIVSFGLYSAQFAPAIYAMSSTGPLRMQNIIFYSLIFFIMFDVFYVCGWLLKRTGIKVSQGYSPWCVLAFAAVLAFGAYSSGDFKNITAVEAINSIMSGEAQSYGMEYDRRLAVLKDGTYSDVVFKTYTARPKLLFFCDATDRADDWLNSSIAEFYGKASVVISSSAAVVNSDF